MADKRIDELTELPPADLETGMWLAIGRTGLSALKLDTAYVMGEIPYVQEDFVANDTLGAAESGTTCTNIGAVGTVTLTAPPATVGMWFDLVRAANQELRFLPSGSEFVQGGGAGKYLMLLDYGRIRVKCMIAGQWTVFIDAALWDIQT